MQVDVRDVDSISGSGRFPGGEHGNPLQYSWLKNPMDRGTWWPATHRCAQSQTQLRRLSTHVPPREIWKGKILVLPEASTNLESVLFRTVPLWCWKRCCQGRGNGKARRGNESYQSDLCFIPRFSLPLNVYTAPSFLVVCCSYFIISVLASHWNLSLIYIMFDQSLKYSSEVRPGHLRNNTKTTLQCIFCRVGSIRW